MLISRGAVKTPTFPGATSDWFYNYERANSVAGYAALYKSQTWVYVVVGKRARSLARLPLKTYLRDELNRPEAPASNAYRALIDNPNPAISQFRFWEWVSSTRDVYGEAFLFKRRDRGGRPYQLVPLHPTGMTQTNSDGTWTFQNAKVRLDNIQPNDLVHFSSYNPDETGRGLSPLEPLRATLENEWAALTASASFWTNGARPGFVLKHPANLSEPAQTRLRTQFDGQYGGAKNAGRTLILEEGMEPFPLSYNQEDSQYIETRKLNREEVCAVYDMPPPAVQILDHATYSNITEQNRALYRDTVGAMVESFESDLDAQLRAPDFGDDVYAEFLMDGVLRGDFEQRTDAYAKADYMTVAEKRRAENLPFIEGTDIILVNTASLPLDRLNEPGPTDAGVPGRQDALPATVPAADNAQPAKTLVVPSRRLDEMRTVMGRLGRAKTVDEIDEESLLTGLDERTARAVSAQLHRAVSWGETVPELRERLKLIGKEIAR